VRIWIINHYAIPPNFSGGTRHYNLAKELIKRGHEVCIIAANYSHFTHEYIAAPAVLSKNITVVEGVPFCWVPVPKYFGNTPRRLWNMLIFAGRILRKKYLPINFTPDVIIGSSPHLFAAFSAYILAKRYHVPFVFEVRDIWPETLVLLGSISPHNPAVTLMGWIEKFLCKRATAIVTLLPDASKHMIANGAALTRIHWLPNFIDAKVVFQQKPILHVEPNKYFTFMYAGAHGLANNLSLVLKAALLLEQDINLKDKIRIVLIGDGPQKPALMEEAKAQNISIVSFHNQVPKAKMYDILNQADAFLMLLLSSPVFKWGVSPNKLFDYMLMARPIIFGVSSSNNPVAVSSAGLTINPDSPEELAHAMRTIAELPLSAREQMGMNAKAYVIANHEVSNIVDRLEKLLSDVGPVDNSANLGLKH